MQKERLSHIELCRTYLFERIGVDIVNSVWCFDEYENTFFVQFKKGISEAYFDRRIKSQKRVTKILKYLRAMPPFLFYRLDEEKSKVFGVNIFMVTIHNSEILN